MEPLIVGIISIIFLVIAVLSGIRIAFAMGIVSMVGLWIITGNISVAMNLVSLTFFSGIKDYSYAVLPLFIMVGVILSVTDMGDDIFKSAEILLRRLRGGIAIATILANGVFAAIVGSSIASAASFSKIAYEPMVNQGYDKKLAVGTIAGSSVLGMLIPPSLLFILYGMLTGASIGEMFMAGIVPGLVLIAIFSAAIIIMLKINPELAPKQENNSNLSKEDKLKIVAKPWYTALLIVVVLGGIYIGAFTPTEAGAVGVGGAMLIGLLTKQINLEKFIQILKETGDTSGSILLLLVTAQMYSRMIAVSGVVPWLNGIIINSSLPIMVILVFVLILVFFMGMIIDSASIFLLILPMVTPMLVGFDINLIWFGVVLTLVTEMGLITPPFGVSVFTVKSSLGDKVELEDIFEGSVPFLIGILLLVVILFIFPNIATWLPNMMFAR